MKTLITLIVSLVFTFLSSTLSAANQPDPLKFSNTETIIDHYINATLHGEVDLLEFLFTDDFSQSSPNKQNTEQIDKSQLIKYLKSLKGIEFSCDTNIEFLEKNEDCSIVKVTKHFSNFNRVDYVTLSNTEDGWKINNVQIAYPQK